MAAAIYHKIKAVSFNLNLEQICTKKATTKTSRQMSGTITHKFLDFIETLRSYRLIVLCDHHSAVWTGGIAV